MNLRMMHNIGSFPLDFTGVLCPKLGQCSVYARLAVAVNYHLRTFFEQHFCDRKADATRSASDHARFSLGRIFLTEVILGRHTEQDTDDVQTLPALQFRDKRGPY